MIDAIGAVALLKRPCHRPISRQARTPSAARISYDRLAGPQRRPHRFISGSVGNARCASSGR